MQLYFAKHYMVHAVKLPDTHTKILEDLLKALALFIPVRPHTLPSEPRHHICLSTKLMISAFPTLDCIRLHQSRTAIIFNVIGSASHVSSLFW